MVEAACCSPNPEMITQIAVEPFDKRETLFSGRQ
jgi:hypothetical protein